MVAIVFAALIMILFAIPVSNFVAGGSQQNLSFTNNHVLSHIEQFNNSAVASALDSALNRHDSQAALALFSDSAVIYDLSNIVCLPGPPPSCSVSNGQIVFASKVQIRGWLEQLATENVTVKEVGGFNVTGDNVSWTLEVTVNEFRRLDIGPLVATAQATIHNGRIDSLTIKLTPDSLTKLSLAYSSSQRAPYSVLAAGLSLGVITFGLVFPAAAIYYISRVKRLFASVPRLDRPWILLGAGVGTLLVSLLLESIGDLTGVSPATTDSAFTALLAICAFLVMLSMFLMKRVIIGEADE
jgi:hypothetical protein